MRRFALISVLSCTAILSSVGTGTSARAQEPYACLNTLADENVRMHNRWLERRFDEAKTRARLYWYGQVLIWTGISVAQTVLAVTSDGPPERFPNTVGTVGAWLTLTQLIVLPVTSAFAPQRFRRQPNGTPEQRLARLRYGLELLEKSADRAALQGGPGAHVVPFLWSAFWGSYISVRFKDAWTSVRLIGGGILVSEFRILTMPQQAVRDWEAIRGMICGANYIAPYDDTYAPMDDEPPEVEEQWDDGLPDGLPDGEPPAAEPEPRPVPDRAADEPETPFPNATGPHATWRPTLGGATVHVTW